MAGDLNISCQEGAYSKSPTGEPVYRDKNGAVRLQTGRMVADKVYRVPSHDRRRTLMFCRDSAGNTWSSFETPRLFLAGMSSFLWKKMEAQPEPVWTPYGTAAGQPVYIPTGGHAPEKTAASRRDF